MNFQEFLDSLPLPIDKPLWHEPSGEKVTSERNNRRTSTRNSSKTSNQSWDAGTIVWKRQPTTTNTASFSATSKKRATDTFNSEFYWSLLDTADEAIEVLLSKHEDYGPSNIADAPGGPVNGLAVRLHDKVARLSNLIKTGEVPKHESLRDTFLDIANYGLIGLLVLDDKWDKA